MKIPWWLWLKFYFDKGLGLTNYAKYAFAFAGFYSLGNNINPNYLLAAGIIYGLTLPFIGWIWVKCKLQDAENEINNMLNPFQREVREKLNGKRFK